jgi:ubiquinone/menaquinone biosynthesis C-methylase UbiE
LEDKSEKYSPSSVNEYDIVAPFYDIEHAHFDEDVDMYGNFAQWSGGSILEFACGTGRLLLPLAREGYTLTGVDNSASMLAIARQHLESEGLSAHCTLTQQDVRTLRLGKTFRLAFIGLGSFGHFIERRDQQQVLNTARIHLSNGGTFILDISNADARYMESLSGHMLHQGTWQQGDGKLLTHFVSPAAASDRHVLELTHFYDLHSQGGPLHRTIGKTYLYLFERNEIELLVEHAGFVIKSIHGDYDLSPYHLDSPRMIVIAEAK